MLRRKQAATHTFTTRPDVVALHVMPAQVQSDVLPSIVKLSLLPVAQYRFTSAVQSLGLSCGAQSAFTRWSASCPMIALTAVVDCAATARRTCRSKQRMLCETCSKSDARRLQPHHTDRRSPCIILHPGSKGSYLPLLDPAMFGSNEDVIVPARYKVPPRPLRPPPFNLVIDDCLITPNESTPSRSPICPPYTTVCILSILAPQLRLSPPSTLVPRLAILPLLVPPTYSVSICDSIRSHSSCTSPYNSKPAT